MTTPTDMVTFRDREGRTVQVYPMETQRMGVHFSVEIVDAGECVDHFMLYSPAALEATKKARGWHKVKSL